MSQALSGNLPRSATSIPGVSFKSRDARRMRDKAFVVVCIVAASMSLVTLAVLLISIFVQGAGKVNLNFLTGVPSRVADNAGIWPPLIGTVITCIICAVTAVPIGIGTAILLEEYKPKSRGLQRAHAFIQLNITNLAGVPSIVYGILGLTVFANMFNYFGTQLEPTWEFGVQWYDTFYTHDGRALSVPVNGKGAPATKAAPGLVLKDAEGREVKDVRIVSREELAPILEQAEGRVETFGDAMAPTLDRLDAATPEALTTAAEQAWMAAGLQSDKAKVVPELTAALGGAKGLEGRERRRVVRNAMELVEQAEAKAMMPNMLAADAVPSRVADVSPWYLRVPLGRGVLAGGLTLMLVILPIIIISSQEALRAVPRSLRNGSYALGATAWQTIWKITLPSAVPGIMTGTILAMSRAIGEAAPMLIIAGIVYVTFTPKHLMDDFTVMPLQIFQWASRPQAEFHAVAAAGIILLLAILLLFNGVAIWIRQRTQKPLS